MTNRIPVVIKSLFQRKLDATEFLTRHHLKIEGILLQLKLLSQISQRGFVNQRKDIQKRFRQTFETLLLEIETHVRMEETVFYPECEKFERIKSLISESYDEHAQLNEMLREMKSATLGSVGFDQLLTQFIKQIESHVMEEEEDIFPLARRQITATRLEKMTHQMRSGKKKSKRSAAAA